MVCAAPCPNSTSPARCDRACCRWALFVLVGRTIIFVIRRSFRIIFERTFRHFIVKWNTGPDGTEERTPEVVPRTYKLEETADPNILASWDSARNGDET